jgi:DNA polymerase III subunit delta'
MFFFKEIIGQTETKNKLIQEWKEGRIPHALLISGPEGIGKMALALSYARLLLCDHPIENEGCGTCPSCIKINKLVHPDLHFAFPIIKIKSKETVCDDYIKDWRELLIKNQYFSFQEWLKIINAGNTMPIIYEKESDEIARKLVLKSSEGGYKIMLIWYPEKMNITCANKILKLLEEPPARTVFILVSDRPDNILGTILSRSQRINVPPIQEKDIADTLRTNWKLSEKDARDVAHLSGGSLIKAINTITSDETNSENLKLFISLMRLAYMRNIKELKEWSEKVAAWGRENQKMFLEYAQRMIRENFINNFNIKDLIYLTEAERNFSANFSPYINENNAVNLMYELDKAQKDIEQNANAKIVFFDLVLKMIVLLKH